MQLYWVFLLHCALRFLPEWQWSFLSYMSHTFFANLSNERKKKEKKETTAFDTQLFKDKFCFWELNEFFYSKVNRNGILLPKLFWRTVRKNCSSGGEKLLKFEAEGLKFANFVRSREQFIQTVKGQNNYW